MTLCRNALAMGISGAGKSSAARGIASGAGFGFLEADELHTPENIEAMSRGVPLDDDARWGWLERICEAVAAENQRTGLPLVIACSALKRRYRDLMRERLGAIAIVHLDGAPELIRQRMVARTEHFMPVALLESQLRDLEPPDPLTEAPVLRLDVARDLDAIVAEGVQFCRHHVAGAGTSQTGTASQWQHANPGPRPKPGGDYQ